MFLAVRISGALLQCGSAFPSRWHSRRLPAYCARPFGVSRERLYLVGLEVPLSSWQYPSVLARKVWLYPFGRDVGHPTDQTSFLRGWRETDWTGRPARPTLGAITGSHIPPVWLLPPASSCHSVPRICRAGCTRLTGGIGHPTHSLISPPPGHPSRGPPLGGVASVRVG